MEGVLRSVDRGQLSIVVVEGVCDCAPRVAVGIRVRTVVGRSGQRDVQLLPHIYGVRIAKDALTTAAQYHLVVEIYHAAPLGYRYDKLVSVNIVVSLH